VISLRVISSNASAVVITEAEELMLDSRVSSWINPYQVSESTISSPLPPDAAW